MADPLSQVRAAGTGGQRRLVDALRIANKHLLNPLMLRLAGREHWYASAIHHVGRRSGRHYSTPIVAVPVAHGFLVPLPYGRGADWVRNVLAAGGATLTTSGHTYQVTHPTVVDAAAALGRLPASRARTFRAFGIADFLDLDVGDADGAGSDR